MKFKDFLNEAPYIQDAIQNDPELPNRMYEHRNKTGKPTLEWEWKGYKVIEHKGKYGTTDVFVMNDDNVELYVAYDVSRYPQLGDMYKNSYIQKGLKSKFNNDLIIEFTFHMIKIKHAKGIISDDIQSTGGKKMWRNILEYGSKNNMDVGVYDNQNYEKQAKEPEKKFALWYAIRSREVYSDKDLMKANFQLYVMV